MGAVEKNKRRMLDREMAEKNEQNTGRTLDTRTVEYLTGGSRME